jgi:hypothetical protein
MTSRLRTGLVAVALIAACPSAPALAATKLVAPEVLRARAFFENWEYERAFNTLVPYRYKAGGSPEVDFLIAASACKIAQKDLPARGRAALASLEDRYQGSKEWARLRAPASEALQTCGQGLQRPIFVAGSAGVSGKFIGKPQEDMTPPPGAMVDDALPEPVAPVEPVTPAEIAPQAAPQTESKSNSSKLRKAMAGIAATAAAAFLSSLAENAGAAAAEKFKDPDAPAADK